MINVTVANFDAEVVNASMQMPVLVDFWAPWCGPCKVIGPLLEKLETEYAGRFKLVKIDSDEQQELSQAFGIRSIPTCVLMSGGKPVDGFMGAQPEGEIKAFLDKNLPAGEVLEAEVTGETVSDAPAADDPVAMHEDLQQALLKYPDDEDARFNYVKLLLQKGHIDDAKVAFAPVIAKTTLVRRFDSLQRWMNAIDFATERTDLTDAATGLEQTEIRYIDYIINRPQAYRFQSSLQPIRRPVHFHIPYNSGSVPWS